MAVIRNLTRQTVVAERAAIATGLIRRMVGLLSRSHLDEGEALIFPRCSAIHTWFMRFPLDVVFLKTVQSSGFWVLGSGQLPPAPPQPHPPAPSPRPWRGRVMDEMWSTWQPLYLPPKPWREVSRLCRDGGRSRSPQICVICAICGFGSPSGKR
ncbi:MAG: DUF192 domain-containing protein, partial [Candidatus Omnitrophica bacterium]|nr:DUF192 domain-containing protein [Candidatus Omnitrophota bacterium]